MKHRIIYIVMLFTLFGCKEMVECGDGILMTGTASNNLVKFPIDEQDMYTISVTSTACVESDVKVHIAIDTDLVEEYNRDMGTIFYPVPDEVCTLDNSDNRGIVHNPQIVQKETRACADSGQRGPQVMGNAPKQRALKPLPLHLDPVIFLFPA